MSSLPSSLNHGTENNSNPQFKLNLPDEIEGSTFGDVAYLLAQHYEPAKWPRNGDYFMWLLSGYLPSEYVEIVFKKPIPRDVFIEAVRKVESEL